MRRRFAKVVGSGDVRVRGAGRGTRGARKPAERGRDCPEDYFTVRDRTDTDQVRRTYRKERPGRPRVKVCSTAHRRHPS
ncbi:hypothetical protein GCM10009654_37650 [Streptomyces hebeiensis]|uniref:Uncharacterized protein n=1 Tax=Streptomyces hebeiensis TaxID=229486 RepID=A0ABN1UWT7_9ACTN